MSQEEDTSGKKLEATTNENELDISKPATKLLENVENTEANTQPSDSNVQEAEKNDPTKDTQEKHEGPDNIKSETSGDSTDNGNSDKPNHAAKTTKESSKSMEDNATKNEVKNVDSNVGSGDFKQEPNGNDIQRPESKTADSPTNPTNQLDPVMKSVYLGRCSFRKLPPLTKKGIRIFVSSTFSGIQMSLMFKLK